MRTWIVAAAACIVWSLAMVLWRPVPLEPPAPKSQETMSAEPTELSPEPTLGPEEPVAKLAVPSASVPASASPAVDNSKADSQAPSAAPAVGPPGMLTRAEEIVQTMTIRDRLLDALRLEPEDHEWASASEVTIQTSFDSEDRAGLRIAEVDCRSTLCQLRLDTDLENDDERAKAVMQLLDTLKFPHDGGFIHMGEGDDTRAITIVMARTGHVLQ